jgi:hypothetical protein
VGVVEVDGPDGRRWTIGRRRYWPGWREFVDIGCWDAPFVDDFGVGGILAVIVVALAIGILIIVLLPLVLLLGELLIVLAAIVLLGGVWVVEAKTTGPPLETRSRKVWGGHRSECAAEEFARELREIPL